MTAGSSERYEKSVSHLTHRSPGPWSCQLRARLPIMDQVPGDSGDIKRGTVSTGTDRIITADIEKDLITIGDIM